MSLRAYLTLLAGVAALHANTVRAEVNESSLPEGWIVGADSLYAVEGGTSTVVNLGPNKGALQPCIDECTAQPDCLAFQQVPAAKGPADKPGSVTGCRLWSSVDGLKGKVASAEENTQGRPFLVFYDRARGPNGPCKNYVLGIDAEGQFGMTCTKAPVKEPVTVPEGYEVVVSDAYRIRGGSLKTVKNGGKEVTDVWCAEKCTKNRKCLGLQMRPATRSHYYEKGAKPVKGKPNSCALYLNFKNASFENGYTEDIVGGHDVLLNTARAKASCKEGQYFGWYAVDGSVTWIGCKPFKKEGESCAFYGEYKDKDLTNNQSGCAPILKCSLEDGAKCVKV